MSAAATAAGYLYASGRLKRRLEMNELRKVHGETVARALMDRRRVAVTNKRKPACP